MFDHIIIDKKWIFLCEVNNKLYLTPEEKMPHRLLKSKHFILKVMFVSTLAIPCFYRNRNRDFDGKIGFWPLLENNLAK